MEISIKKLTKAAYQLHLAQHLLEVTYPLVKDPKMLISALSNLEQTHNSMFESVLPMDLVNSDVNFISKLNSFEELLKSAVVLESGEKKTILSVHDLINQHKESAVVFSRKDSFVICEDDYKMNKIDPISVGEQVHNTVKLLNKLSGLVKNDD